MSSRRFAMSVAYSVAGLISALLLAGCETDPAQEPTGRVTGVVPIQEPIEDASAVVNTTAKELDPSTVATVTANPLFDIPDGKYLLLQAREVVYLCYSNCDCPPEDPANWRTLSLSEQEQAMRDMIQQGAKGFVDVVEGRSLSPCSCGYGRERREPIKELPFAWSSQYSDGEFDLTVYSVHSDGTITATVGDATYAFKTGDAWSYEYTNPDPGPPLSECDGQLRRRYMYFENGGLVDESQFPALSTATPCARLSIPEVPGMTEGAAVNYVRQHYPEQHVPMYDQASWECVGQVGQMGQCTLYVAGDWTLTKSGAQSIVLRNTVSGFEWRGTAGVVSGVGECGSDEMVVRQRQVILPSPGRTP